ncbi:MAG: hypothetical protein LBS41_00550 [Streptococcaceae bacterium]|jgi:hypothetical protein|nr:hypothetical protein [Streptococcaceae bacterium]
MKKLHHTQIPADVLADAQEHIDRTNQLLAPYIISLSTHERKEMAKMGDKSLGFVSKAYDFAKKYPNWAPAYLNMTEFAIDLADATNLRTLLVSCQELTHNIDNTVTAAGSEAYNASLVFYQAAKTADKQQMSGAKEVALELKERFPRHNRHAASVTTGTATPDVD